MLPSKLTNKYKLQKNERLFTGTRFKQKAAHVSSFGLFSLFIILDHSSAGSSQ